MMCSTVWTSPFTNRQVFHIMILITATRTNLTGWIESIDFHQRFAIPVALVLQLSTKFAHPDIRNCFCKMAIAHHSCYIQNRLKWYAIFSLFMISPHRNTSAIADRNDFITSDFGRTTVVNNHGGDVANHPTFGAIEHPNFAVVV